jgi:cold shock protein
MPVGTVLHYNDDRGFGFITPDGGGADFVRTCGDLVNADDLRKDQRVSFDIGNDHRRNKPKANQVRVL